MIIKKKPRKNKKYINTKLISIYIYPKLIFFSFILLFFYFENNKKDKGFSINNIHYHYNNTIHLSLNIDDNYFYPCIVYLVSLLDNRAASSFYTVHILTNDKLSEKNKEKINIIKERFGNHSVNFIYYNLDGYFKNTTTGFTSVTYYKLVLPSLLPNLDKIIYTDGDMINLEDLSELYSIEFKENMYFCGIPDYIEHLNQLREFGFSSDK